MACEGGQFELMINNQSRLVSINMNAQHSNGMNPLVFFAVHKYKITRE